MLKFLLPEGIVEFFEVRDIVSSNNQYHIHLEEKNIHPSQFKGVKLTSRGFFDEITIQDFPLRGKPCYLKVRRRKWLNESTGLNVSRDWNLVAEGTRMTEEFAAFLKGIIRQSSGQL